MSKKTTDETLGREAVKEYLQQYHTAVGKKRIIHLNTVISALFLPMKLEITPKLIRARL